MSEDYVRLQKTLMAQLVFDRDLSDEEIWNQIDELLLREAQESYIRLQDRGKLRQALFNSVRRLDLLQELLDDDTVTEIMVNGTQAIYYERSGQLLRWDKRFENQGKLEDIVQQIAAFNNRTATEASPIVDARLQNGARVSIVMAPVAIGGPVITIRRFPDHPISMEQLIDWGSITAEAALFLQTLVKAGYNIFISGGTGTGKTTFLNALSNYIPKDERIITIEDNAELQIQGAKNLVRLEARKAGDDGSGEITIRDLIRASLRMRPNRIIVGEVRGAETIDMLQAMSTGHDGSLSTGHGNSPKDMLMRLETMILFGAKIDPAAIRRQISSGIDVLIHLSRYRDRSRRVQEILEIDGYDQATESILTHPLFTFRETGETDDGKVIGALQKVGSLSDTMKLERAGLSI